VPDELAAGAAPDLLETGVPHLDRILGGGLPKRSIAVIIGAPGTGKTILAQQIAFHGAAQGATALYLTGYSETHDKLLAHNRGLGFFVPDLIGKQIQFGSLPDLLREGPETTVDAIVATAHAEHAALVVLDGFQSMRGFLGDDQTVAYFLYSLGAKLALLGVTTLVVVEGDPEEVGRYPELIVCDVILALRRQRQGSRRRRLLEVLKARGSMPLEGDHAFTVNQTGVAIFPRFESFVAAREPAWNPERAAFGIPELDALIGGGLNVGTTTLVAGSPGVGKTLLGVHFAAEGARAGEPVLFLGFMESATQLREKARVFGMDVSAAEASGQLRLVVLPGQELEADHIATLLTEDIERRGVRRLVIDSAAELERALGSPGRIPEFLSAFVSYLRGREVTTYLTLDVPIISGPALDVAGTPLSIFAENLLLLRQVEYRGRLHRVFSVLKMRFSDYEKTIQEHTITPGRGLQIVGSAPHEGGLLTGGPRPSGEPALQTESSGSEREPWPRS
jgi:circadian clock protein KaiC